MLAPSAQAIPTQHSNELKLSESERASQLLLLKCCTAAKDCLSLSMHSPRPLCAKPETLQAVNRPSASYALQNDVLHAYIFAPKTLQSPHIELSQPSTESLVLAFDTKGAHCDDAHTPSHSSSMRECEALMSSDYLATDPCEAAFPCSNRMQEAGEADCEL